MFIRRRPRGAFRERSFSEYQESRVFCEKALVAGSVMWPRDRTEEAMSLTTANYSRSGIVKASWCVTWRSSPLRAPFTAHGGCRWMVLGRNF